MNVHAGKVKRPTPGRVFNPRSARACVTGRGGFTLIELLLVMVVIAILGTIIMGSATFITRLARKRRAEVACHVLESAITRYRSDYNAWPIGDIEDKDDGSTDGKITVTGPDNGTIFGMLREGSEKNKRGIRYLDETTVFTVNNKGKAVRLIKAGEGNLPLAYVTREGGVMKYFKVVINVDNDTVDVTAPELNN